MLRGIHKLCDKGNWNEASAYILDNADAARDAASKPGGYGEWNPLHLACKRDAPSDIVGSLLELAPEASEAFDIYHRLPIHYVAELGTSDPQVLEVLIETSPDSLTAVDSEGRTPLHLCFLASNPDCNSGDQRRLPPNLQEILLLIDENGDAAKMVDELGCLPLHYACANIDSSSAEIIQAIVGADINSIVALNAEGQTPLHQALLWCVEKSISLDIVRVLTGADVVEEEDAVTEIADNENRLPIHCACENFEQVPYEVFEELLSRSPGAASIESQNGVPLEILEGLRETINSEYPEDVVEFNNKSDIIFAFEPSIEPFCFEEDRMSRLETRIRGDLMERGYLSPQWERVWVFMCTCPEDPDEIYETIVSRTLEFANDSVTRRMLATIEVPSDDGKEMLPLHACSSKRCGELLSGFLRFVDRYEVDMENDTSFQKGENCLTLQAVDCASEEDSNIQSAYRDVQIKFMSDRSAYLRELNFQKMVLAGNRYRPHHKTCHAVKPIIQNFDIERVGTNEELVGDEKFQRDIERFSEGNTHDLSDFRYGFVYPQEKRDFSSIVNERVLNGIGTEHLKKYLKAVVEALSQMHGGGIVYGDIGKNTIVELFDGTVTFKNFDSACEINRQYCGKIVSGDQLQVQFVTSTLPPEMFAELDEDSVQVYNKYWKTIADSALIADLFYPEDVHNLATRVNAFLGEVVAVGSFEHLWDHIKMNANIWKRIAPRKVNGSYYVVKCHLAEKGTGMPIAAEKLPYDLIPAGKADDCWKFGLFLYEILADKSLFDVDTSRDLRNDSDFATLYHWDNGDSKFQHVRDLAAQALLGRLVTKENERVRAIADVIGHPYFCEDSHGTQYRKLQLSILRKKKEQKNREEQEKLLEAEEEERKARLQRRTEKLSVVSHETQLKFKLSTWMQLNDTFVAKDATFPTNCVILPFKLEHDGTSRLMVPVAERELSRRFGLLLANVIHYTGLTIELDGLQDRNACMEKPSDLNKTVVNSSIQPTLLDACDQFVKQSANVESVLCEWMETSSADAGVFVRESLRELAGVDLDLCQKILPKAYEAEKLTLSLLKIAGNANAHSCRALIGDELGTILGKAFSDLRITRKKDIDAVLHRLIDDPAGVSRDLLVKNLHDLVECFVKTQKMFFYFVDEYTGIPVYSSHYLKDTRADADTISLLIPFLHMSVKTACATNFVSGLAQLLSIEEHDVPVEWFSIKKHCVGSFDTKFTSRELFLIQETLEHHTPVGMGEKEPLSRTSLLAHFENFLLTKDEMRVFAGLKRICNRDNDLLLWSRSVSDQKENIARDEEIEYIAKKRKDDLSRSLAAAKEKCATGRGVIRGEPEITENDLSSRAHPNPVEDKDLPTENPNLGTETDRQTKVNVSESEWTPQERVTEETPRMRTMKALGEVWECGSFDGVEASDEEERDGPETENVEMLETRDGPEAEEREEPEVFAPETTTRSRGRDRVRSPRSTSSSSVSRQHTSHRTRSPSPYKNRSTRSPSPYNNQNSSSYNKNRSFSQSAGPSDNSVQKESSLRVQRFQRRHKPPKAQLTPTAKPKTRTTPSNSRFRPRSTPSPSSFKVRKNISMESDDSGFSNQENIYAMSHDEYDSDDGSTVSTITMGSSLPNTRKEFMRRYRK